MFRVLIPSLCITNPLTLNLFPSFWVILSFPIPLETIKRGGDFNFDLYKSSQSNGLVLNISTATRLRKYMLTHTTLLISKMDPIKYIFEKPALSGRIARWQMVLTEYDIQYTTQKQ